MVRRCRINLSSSVRLAFKRKNGSFAASAKLLTETDARSRAPQGKLHQSPISGGLQVARISDTSSSVRDLTRSDDRKLSREEDR